MSGLSIRGLTVDPASGATGGARLPVEDVSFNAPRGAVTAVLGLAGAGKTMLLAAIAGLVKPARGAVFIDGADVTAYRGARRRIGLLPPGTDLGADRKLLPGLRRIAGGTASAALPPMLDAFGLAPLAATRLADFTHGQGFGALAVSRLLPPGDVLLVDDAGTGLDAAMRDALLNSLRQQAQAGRIVVFATRDTALAMQADHLVLLHAGQLHQAATPGALYAEPRDALAARLTGAANVLRGTVRQKMAGGFIWAAAGHKFMHAAAAGAAQPGLSLGGPTLASTVEFCLRPEYLVVNATTNAVPMVVRRMQNHGPLTQLWADSPLGKLTLHAHRSARHWIGETISAGWDTDAAWLHRYPDASCGEIFANAEAKQPLPVA